MKLVVKFGAMWSSLADPIEDHLDETLSTILYISYGDNQDAKPEVECSMLDVRVTAKSVNDHLREKE